MRNMLLFFMFISLSFLTAQPVQQLPVDKEITAKIFGGQWRQADSLIDLEIQKHSYHPKYYFMKAYNAYYCRFVSRDGLPRDVSIRKVYHNCRKAIEAGEELTQTTEVKFYIGSAYAFISRANVMKRDYWTAYWNAGKSEDYFEDVLEEDPDCYDAYLNLGVMEYFPDAMLEGFRSFMAWLGGMSGDKEKGLEYITRAAKNGSIFKEEAKVALAFIYWISENNPPKSFAYWQMLHNTYPASERIAGFYKQMEFINLVYEKGADFLVTEIDSMITKYEITTPYMISNAANQLLENGREGEAKTVFDLVINTFPNAAYSYRAMGEFYVATDNETEAIKYYKIAYNKIDTDTLYNGPIRQRVKEYIAENLEDLGVELSSL